MRKEYMDDYENELINYIYEKTNIGRDSIQDVLSCYAMCEEEDLNLDYPIYYDKLHLLTGYKRETIQRIMKSLVNYEEMLM